MIVIGMLILGIWATLLSILKDEFKYLTSDEAIIEMFEANDYEFFETGKVFNAMEFVLNS